MSTRKINCCPLSIRQIRRKEQPPLSGRRSAGPRRRGQPPPPPGCAPRSERASPPHPRSAKVDLSPQAAATAAPDAPLSLAREPIWPTGRGPQSSRRWGGRELFRAGARFPAAGPPGQSRFSTYSTTTTYDRTTPHRMRRHRRCNSPGREPGCQPLGSGEASVPRAPGPTAAPPRRGGAAPPARDRLDASPTCADSSPVLPGGALVST